MKKFLAFFLALTMVLGLCACGGGGGASGDDDSGLTADGKVKLHIGLPTNALVMSHDENALTKWIEEECNVELKFTEYPGGNDLATQISTTIGARKELPDILLGVKLDQKTVNRYGKDGYFLDLSEYYEDKEGASKVFWDRLENELSEYDQDLVMRKIVTVDNGAIYGVPVVETSLIDKMVFQPWINVEWLNKLGLEKPTNNEELYNVLKAFKEGDPNGNGVADEIPLFGSQQGGAGAYVIDWLINLFIYFNRERPWTVEDGKLGTPFTTDEYREALKFIHKLYKEELLSPLTWTASGSEMKQIITPANGTAMCGIFMGHLTIHCTQNNEIMYQYEPLQTWGCAIRNDASVNLANFITEDCKHPEKAFELLMKLFSWEGSMRSRYGEYGVNWTDATPGAKSDMGLDATYKLIEDPLFIQSTARWAVMGSALNVYAEGETAEISEDMSEWAAKKSAMHAQSTLLFNESAEKYNPESIPPLLTTTEEEKQATEMERTNVIDRWNKAQTEFCSGVLDPNNDTDWNNYVKQLEDLGLQVYLDYLQVAYDRG